MLLALRIAAVDNKTPATHKLFFQCIDESPDVSQIIKEDRSFLLQSCRRPPRLSEYWMRP
jgi:hypothetical protein